MNFIENIDGEFSKKNIKSISNRMCTEVTDGNVNALQTYIKAKFFDSLSKEIIKTIKDDALDEALNYSKNDSEYNKAKFSISNTGNTLDYSADSEYADLEKQLKARKDKLKKAFDMSKDGDAYLDGESGELITVVPVKKQSEQILKITF